MKCPNPWCDNDGTIMDHHQNCDGNCRDGQCPIQVQCEWCYTNPESDMNLKADAVIAKVEG